MSHFCLFLAACLACTIAIVFDEKPMITHGPTETFGLENQPVTLQCRIRGTQSTKISWYQNRTLIDSIPLFHVETKTLPDGLIASELSTQLSTNTVGVFYCNASNSVGWAASTPAQLKIAFMDDNFVLQPMPKTANIGETILFACQPPNASPKPSVSWFKDGREVTTSARVQVLDSGNLRIEQVTWADAGVYWCVASSSAFQRISEKAPLTVRQRPYFVVAPASQFVPLNGVLELACRVAGEPQPLIMWKRDPPVPVIPSNRAALLSDGSLRIVNVQSEDVGNYICQASSEGGVVEAVARIDIISSPGFTSTPPGYVVTLEGTTIHLPCAASGSPSPEIRWIRKETSDYYVGGITTSSDRITTGETGSLIIKSARISDAGTYECRASSPVGLTRTTTKLHVRPNPSLFPGRVGAVSPPIIRLSSREPPDMIKLLCSVPEDSGFVKYMSIDSADNTENSTQSFPFASYDLRWYKGDQDLSLNMHPNNRYSIESDGSLVIHHLMESDAANYTCSVTSLVSKRLAVWDIRLMFDVNPQHFVPTVYFHLLPAAPFDLQVSAVGDSWISLKWHHDGSLQDRFQVFFLLQTPSANYVSPSKSVLQMTSASEENRKYQFDYWELAKESTSERRFNLLGLLPDSGYWIEVRAFNAFGWSQGSIFPRPVYTQVSSFVVFPNAFPHSDSPEVSNALIDKPGGGRLAQDFQDMVSRMHGIAFPRVSARSLSSSEVLVSWTTKGSSGALKLVDGFLISAKPVFMSRCLAAASSNIKANRGVSAQHWIFGGVNSYVGALLNDRTYCSFSNEFFLEKIHQDALLGGIGHLPTSVSSGNETSNRAKPIPDRTVLVPRSVSREDPTTGTVIGDLHPFSCYEISVKAFKNDLTYGKIWSRETQAELVMSLDSTPSQAPQLRSANWLSGHMDIKADTRDSQLSIDMAFTGASRKFSTDSHGSLSNRSVFGGSYPISSHGIRLSWAPLDIHVSHGALLGYSIHIVANESEFSHSKKVPPDVHMHDVHGLNPHVEYTIFLAGITCRGEGVRGPGYRMPVLASLVSSPTRLSAAPPFPSWAYGVVCGIVVVWITVGLLVYLCACRREPRCCLHNSVAEAKTKTAVSATAARTDSIFLISAPPPPSTVTTNPFPPSSASSGTKSSQLTDCESSAKASEQAAANLFQRRPSFALKNLSSDTRGNIELVRLLSQANSFCDTGGPRINAATTTITAVSSETPVLLQNSVNYSQEENFTKSTSSGSSMTAHGQNTYYNGQRVQLPPPPNMPFPTPMTNKYAEFMTADAASSTQVPLVVGDPAYSMVSSGMSLSGGVSSSFSSPMAHLQSSADGSVFQTPPQQKQQQQPPPSMSNAVFLLPPNTQNPHVVHQFASAYDPSSQWAPAFTPSMTSATDEVPPYASSCLMLPDCARNQTDSKPDFAPSTTAPPTTNPVNYLDTVSVSQSHWSAHPTPGITQQRQLQHQLVLPPVLVVNSQSANTPNVVAVSTAIPPPPPYPPPPLPMGGAGGVATASAPFTGEQFRHLSDDGSLPSSGSYFTGYYAPEGVVIQPALTNGSLQQCAAAQTPVATGNGLVMGSGSGMSSLSGSSGPQHSGTPLGSTKTGGGLQQTTQQLAYLHSAQGYRNAGSSLGSGSGSGGDGSSHLRSGNHRGHFTGNLSGTLSSNESANSGPPRFPSVGGGRGANVGPRARFGSDQFPPISKSHSTNSGGGDGGGGGGSLSPSSCHPTETQHSLHSSSSMGSRIPEEGGATSATAATMGSMTYDHSVGETDIADNMTYSEVNSSEGERDGDDEMDGGESCAGYEHPVAAVGFVS